jgi:predicted RNase H-like HicB family nuclease
MTLVGRSKKYRVRYTRDESGWWQASVPDVQGCHTQGRTIEEARRRVREALGLFIDNASDVTLKDEVQMPKRVADVVKRYRAAWQRADREQRGVPSKPWLVAVCISAVVTRPKCWAFRRSVFSNCSRPRIEDARDLACRTDC